jgi:hypothetical protein
MLWLEYVVLTVGVEILKPHLLEGSPDVLGLHFLEEVLDVVQSAVFMEILD